MKASSRSFRILAGLAGIVGPVVLVASFRMNPAPPPGLGTAALAAWAAPREGLMLLGGWAQGIGSLLIVLFAYALAELSDDVSPFAAQVTRLSGAVILMTSLVEVALYIAVVQAVTTGDTNLGLVAKGLIEAVQHIFLIAPALLIPMSITIFRSSALPAIFAYSGLAIGVTLQALGLAELFTPLQPVVDVLLIVQSVWFIAAGATLMLRGDAARARP